MSFNLAPSVVYPVGRSRRLLLGILALAAAAFTVLMAWWGHGEASQPGWLVGLAWCAWGGFGVWAVWDWSRPVARALRWDGLHWHAESDGAIADGGFCSVSVCWDLQGSLWVMVVPRGGRRFWLWLDASACPERWLDLRRALYSPRSHDADVAWVDTTH